MWGATADLRRCNSGYTDFNPRTPCGVRLPGGGALQVHHLISIHAPRVGCDVDCAVFGGNKLHFNPRTPCGVRQAPSSRIVKSNQFQSTHPVWGATGVRICGCSFVRISIHAPRVGCDPFFQVWVSASIQFQSTHPVWGATRSNPSTASYAVLFQSTHPVWGATRGNSHDYYSFVISIHAPRVGCDYYICVIGPGSCHFNPRTPCGVRRGAMAARLTDIKKFQSTHPVWGATNLDAWEPCDECNFNPRTPCGVRLCLNVSTAISTVFQSTHPVWGATKTRPVCATRVR